jgi:hypothetical protein
MFVLIVLRAVIPRPLDTVPAACMPRDAARRGDKCSAVLTSASARSSTLSKTFDCPAPRFCPRRRRLSPPRACPQRRPHALLRAAAIGRHPYAIDRRSRPLSGHRARTRQRHARARQRHALRVGLGLLCVVVLSTSTEHCQHDFDAGERDPFSSNPVDDFDD